MIVYKTTNIVNGKIYVGKDVKNNPDYIGSGLILKNATDKYGRKNFIKEVLEVCIAREELNEREKFWIKNLNSTDRNVGYNISPGGYGGNIYINLPDEIKNKIKSAVSNANKSRPKVFGQENKTYKSVDPKVKDIIISLSQTMGRDKIYQTIVEMGLQCPARRTITRRLQQWKVQPV